MCALRAHIKLFIFRKLFLGIKKTVIIFSILEKKIFKNKNFQNPYINISNSLSYSALVQTTWAD